MCSAGICYNSISIYQAQKDGMSKNTLLKRIHLQLLNVEKNVTTINLGKVT